MRTTVILIVLLSGCAIGSHAAGKRSGAHWAQLPGCFEEEFDARETPVTAEGFWWIACKGEVWKCRGRGLKVPPECHLDDEAKQRYAADHSLP